MRELKLFIGSPGDVAAEREAVFELIARLNDDPLVRDLGFSLRAIGWDRTAHRRTAWLSPQRAIDQGLPRPSQCEFAIFLFCNRIGTPLPDGEYETLPEHASLPRLGRQELTGSTWELVDAMSSGLRRGTPDVATWRLERDLVLPSGESREAKQGLLYQQELLEGFFEKLGGRYLSRCRDKDKLAKGLEDHIRSFLRDLARKEKRAVPPAEARREPRRPQDYLDWVAREAARVEVLVADLQQATNARLPDVYVPALTSQRERPSTGEAERLPGREREFELLLSRLDERSLYVPGAPGSGKSTFCRWASGVVARGSVSGSDLEAPEEYREQVPLDLVARLPVLVPLRELDRHVKPGAEKWTRAELIECVAAWIESKRVGLLGSDLEAHLDDGSCLLLLDGFDEVPERRGFTGGGAAAFPRAAILSGLADALGSERFRRNRILLTSRPYGLAGAERGRLGLEETPLLPLVPGLQDLFVRRWFTAVDRDHGARKAEEMLREIEKRPDLTELRDNPMLLTAFCIRFDEGGRLPRDIHELYDTVTTSVLFGRFRNHESARSLVRRRLGVIALDMHTGDAIGEAREEPAAQVSFEEVEQSLKRYAESDRYDETSETAASEKREELLSRSGLLLPQGPNRAGFYHLTFQDFLAAERLARTDQPLAKLLEQRGQQVRWHQTLEFLFARTASQRTLGAALQALDSLRPALEPGALASDPTPALLVGRCLEVAQAQGEVGDWARLFQGACRAAIAEDMPPETLVARAALLRSLGQMQLDDRQGVGLRADGVPDIDLVPIPRGEVTLEGRSECFPVEPFEIARYPVTWAQFHAFESADDGHSDPRWWQGLEPPLAPADAQWPIPNHPREMVSWYEAIAFCRWLSARLGREVSLPTEMEWQQAATGGDPAREYPWGSWKEGRTNSFETGLGRTTAVGLFSQGRSLQGVSDLAANVWEWCLNRYKPPSHTEVDASGEFRVLRGGSWLNDRVGCRSASRLRGRPDKRIVDVGFRVVCRPQSSAEP